MKRSLILAAVIVLSLLASAKVPYGFRELTEDEKKNLVQSALKYVETANNHR